MKSFYCSFIFLLFSFYVQAQKDNRFTTGFSETISSKILGENREILIHIPKSNEGNKIKDIGKGWFSPKQQPSNNEVIPTSNVIQSSVRYHTVASGDLLWIIANKYYSNPSQENIEKIMKANNMKRIGLLKLGQKLVVPE